MCSGNEYVPACTYHGFFYWRIAPSLDVMSSNSARQREGELGVGGEHQSASADGSYFKLRTNVIFKVLTAPSFLILPCKTQVKSLRAGCSVDTL